MNWLNKLAKSKKYKDSKWTEPAVIFMGLAVFIYSSLLTITNSSIWFDEAFGVYLTRFDFFEIMKYTAADVHPPLYYIILKIWGSLFGNSEFALRSMSVVFGAVALIFGYLVIKKMFNKQIGWVALLFMSISPMFIRYAQEARMYTMVFAIAMAATYILILALEKKKRWLWVVYGTLLAVGMLTHYFIALIWLVHWIWVGYLRKDKGGAFERFVQKDWMIAHVVAIALFLPWLPSLINQLLIVQTAGFWIAPVSIETIVNFISNILMYQDGSEVKSWMLVGFAIFVTVATAIVLKVYRDIDNKYKDGYRLLVALVVVPVVLLVAGSLPPLRSSFVDRYLLASSALLPALIGISIYLYKYRRQNRMFMSMAAMVVVLMFGIANVWVMGNYNKNTHSTNMMRQAIQATQKAANDGEPIIMSNEYMIYEASFYDNENNQNPMYFIAPDEYRYGSLAMLRDNDDYKIKDLEIFTNTNDIVWYLKVATSEPTPPYDNWKKIQEVIVSDLSNSKDAYWAIQYQVIK